MIKPFRLFLKSPLSAVSAPIFLAFLCCLASPAQAAVSPQVREIERHVLQLTNQLRQTQGKSPYRQLGDLDDVARFHSQNMAQKGFFSHRDPAGRGPSDRLRELKPLLMVGGAGENIAYNYGYKGSARDMAQRLVTQWKNSPGHYRNMMGGNTHMGSGIALRSGKVYGTQIFASPVARFVKSPPTEAQQGQPVRLELEFLGAFPKKDIYFYLKFPDKKARFYTSSGSFYTGGGPITPRWEKGKRFSLELPTDKGLGLYRLNVGRNGRFSPSPYSLNVRAAQTSRATEGNTEARHAWGSEYEIAGPHPVPAPYFAVSQIPKQRFAVFSSSIR